MSVPKNVVLLLSFFLLLHQPNKLNAVDPCIYDLNTQGIIDLTSIGHVDGTPVWKNIPPEISDRHVYSYNPCHSFTQGNCIDVAACQMYDAHEELTYSLGTQNSIQWRITAGQDIPTLVYGTTQRTLEVNLICLKSREPNKLEVHGQDTPASPFKMTLSSQCVCWNGCKGGSGPKSNNGLTGGVILIIILIVLLVVYLIAFMSYNKFHRQATGIEILPHRTFWTSLPGYSLDGILFVFRKGIGKRTDYNTI